MAFVEAFHICLYRYSPFGQRSGLCLLFSVPLLSDSDIFLLLESAPDLALPAEVDGVTSLGSWLCFILIELDFFVFALLPGGDLLVPADRWFPFGRDLLPFGRGGLCGSSMSLVSVLEDEVVLSIVSDGIGVPSKLALCILVPRAC